MLQNSSMQSSLFNSLEISPIFSAMKGIALLPAMALFVFMMLLFMQASFAYNRNSEMDELIQTLQKTQATLESQLLSLNSQMELMKQGQSQLNESRSDHGSFQDVAKVDRQSQNWN